MRIDDKRIISTVIAPMLVVLIVAFYTPVCLAAEEDSGWPRQLDAAEGKIMIYQPQPESLESNVLKGRAAVSVTPQGKDEPVFGAIWFESQVHIDRYVRIAQILNVKVIRVHIADAIPEQEQNYTAILKREIGGLQFTISYDRLLASLEAAEAQKKSAESLNNAPPKILFETVPAILVVIDGKPQLRTIGTSELMKVINTPFFIVLEPKSKLYWLNGGTTWFTATDIMGGWKPNKNPPEKVANAWKAEQNAVGAKNTSPRPTKDKRVPRIIVATEPTELIVAEGEPKFSPIVGNELLYMSNTEDDVFMDIAAQDYYVVLSGRWYRSKSMQGPWKFVRSDQLPKSFANIAENSEKGDVLTFVAGTTQSKEAIMDSQVPQTAAIKRSEAKLQVTYDGEPQFKLIPKTTIEYAVNTDKTVLKIADRYYCCDQAVWFVANDPMGPWVICDRVPLEVQSIPPESPCYNVKYVYVYDSTPDVVYVGYTPGYYWCYPYYGTIVYGTGFHYPCWVGTVCYSQPYTWGFHVNYNPWTGWCFGMSWSSGWSFFSIGFGHHGGWWSPGGYCWRPHYNYFNRPLVIYRPVNIYTRDIMIGSKNRFRETNLYNWGENRNRVADVGTFRMTDRSLSSSKMMAVKNQENNVFVDRNGNVLRREKEGTWLQRDQGHWSPTETQQTRPLSETIRPQTDQRVSQPHPQMSRPQIDSLDREHIARTRGAERTQSFRGRSSGSSSRGRQ